jgi:hypothetical protein
MPAWLPAAFGGRARILPAEEGNDTCGQVLVAFGDGGLEASMRYRPALPAEPALPAFGGFGGQCGFGGQVTFAKPTEPSNGFAHQRGFCGFAMPFTSLREAK